MLYGLGMVMRRAATFIMLPLYTRLLSPADYGLLQMLDMSLDVVAILVSAGTTAGVMRFYHKATTQRERHEVLATASILLTLLNAVGSLLLAAAAGPVHRHLLGGAGAEWFVVLAAANFTLHGLMNVPLLAMQAEGRAGLYSAVSLAKLVVQLALNVFFLVALDMGPVGILLSTFVANLVVGGASLAWMLRRTGLAFSRQALRDLRRFGVPYQIATAATFILQFGDRFFLEQSWGLAAVGLYGFAYQFGFMLDQIGNTPFVRAWQPRRFAQAAAPREVREADDNRDFLTLSLIVVTLGLGMALFARPAIRIIAGPDFHGAANLVPIVVAAFIVQSWTGVLHFGIDAAERTTLATAAMWISALAVLLLYALLIPPLGAMGAVLATLAAFVVRFACFYVFSRRVWPMRYTWAPHLRLLAVAVVLTTLAWLLPVQGLLGQVVIGSFGMMLYAYWVWTGVATSGHRAVVHSLLRRLPGLQKPRAAGVA